MAAALRVDESPDKRGLTTDCPTPFEPKKCEALSAGIYSCTFCHADCPGQYFFDTNLKSWEEHDQDTEDSVSPLYEAQLVTVQSENKHNCMIELIKLYQGTGNSGPFAGARGNNKIFNWPNGDRVPLDGEGEFQKWHVDTRWGEYNAQPDCCCGTQNPWCNAADPLGSCLHFWDAEFDNNWWWDDTNCDFQKTAILEKEILCTDSECDDGVYCNGQEICSGDGCVGGPPPCAPTEICIEGAGVCTQRYCGKYDEKVYVCHKANKNLRKLAGNGNGKQEFRTLCIDPISLQDHLDHGDYEGACIF